MRMTSHNIGNLPGGIIRRFLFPSGITSVGIRYRQNNSSLHGRPKKPQNRLAHVGRRSLITYHYSGSNHRPLQGSQFAFDTKKKTLLENHWRNNLSIRSPLHHVLQHSEPVSRLLFSPRHRRNDYIRHFLFTIITWVFRPDFILGMRVYQHFDFRGKA